MSDDNGIRQRIESARDETITFTHESDDPVVVYAENETTDGGPYLLVPATLSCGCQDNFHRDTICKHLLAFGMEQDTAVLVEALSAYRDELRTERGKINAAMRAIDNAVIELDPQTLYPALGPDEDVDDFSVSETDTDVSTATIIEELDDEDGVDDEPVPEPTDSKDELTAVVGDVIHGGN